MLDQNPNPHTVFAHRAVCPLTYFTALGWRHEVSPIAYSLLQVADNFSESYCSLPPHPNAQLTFADRLGQRSFTRSPQMGVALCRGKPPSPKLHPTLWSAADHTLSPQTSSRLPNTQLQLISHPNSSWQGTLQVSCFSWASLPHTAASCE